MRSSRLAQVAPATPASFVDESDAFLTPLDEKDLAAGILCLGTAGGAGKGKDKGKGRVNVDVQDVRVGGEFTLENDAKPPVDSRSACSAQS